MNLKQALKLYEILKDYLPDEYEDHFDFIKQIIDNINAGERKDDYANALDVLVGHRLTNEELEFYTSEELIQTFSGKLIEMGIFDLIKFCNTMGI